MLTAEKTHLLLTRDDGLPLSPRHHDVALAAAAIADLRSAAVVTVEEGDPARARMVVTAGGATGSPVLDALLPAADRHSGVPVSTLVAKGRPAARKPVVARLVETGDLIEHKAFLNTRHVPASDATRLALTGRLSAVAQGETEPSDEDRLLLGILHHLNVAGRLLPHARGAQERREFVRGLESLTRGDTLVQAVRRAVGTRSGAAAAAAAAADRSARTDQGDPAH